MNKFVIIIIAGLAMIGIIFVAMYFYLDSRCTEVALENSDTRTTKEQFEVMRDYCMQIGWSKIGIAPGIFG